MLARGDRRGRKFDPAYCVGRDQVDDGMRGFDRTHDAPPAVPVCCVYHAQADFGARFNVD